MKKFVLFIYFMFLSLALADSSEEPKKSKDTITISSGYFEKWYTNDQLAVFGSELLKAGRRLEKYTVDNSSVDTSEWLVWLPRILTMYLYKTFRNAYHEIGHGLKNRAYGADYALLKDDKTLTSFEKNENFFKYFVKKLGSPRSRGACYASKELADTEELVVSAGGMNNEIYLAERQAEDFHKNGSLGGVESFYYFYNRLSPVAYASKGKSEEDRDKPDTDVGDDPIAIEGYYKKLGISARKSDIKSAGVISLLLSGMTYSILWGAYKNLSTDGGYTPKPFNVWGIRIPDTFSYITSKGISYKVVSGYKMDENLNLIFGLETVLHGKSANEFSLGFDKTFGESLHNISCKVVTTFGKGFNVEASCSYPILECLSINFGGGSYSSKSLLGERHAKNMENGKGRSNNVFVSISFLY
ncbi:MAG: hypothetical protein LBS23_01875 [Holosporaceae bacterium]|jgi:hypothetical protein|nr:hypothetical protein [Holosporaceae bacterium]